MIILETQDGKLVEFQGIVEHTKNTEEKDIIYLHEHEEWKERYGYVIMTDTPEQCKTYMDTVKINLAAMNGRPHIFVSFPGSLKRETP